MVQVSVEMRFSNPVLAINSLRRFDSALISLRKLAEVWLNAESILHIFEESPHFQHDIRPGKSLPDGIQSSAAGNTSDNNTTNTLNLNTPPEDCMESVDERTDLEIPVDAAYAKYGDRAQINETSLDQADALNDLHQLPRLTAGDDLCMDLDVNLMAESEWREIYWQDPGVSELFIDGSWGWP
jgi:transcriptional regulatory protein AMDR